MKRKRDRQRSGVTCEACGKPNVYGMLKHLQCNDACNSYYHQKNIHKVIRSKDKSYPSNTSMNMFPLSTIEPSSFHEDFSNRNLNTNNKTYKQGAFAQ